VELQLRRGRPLAALHALLAAAPPPGSPPDSPPSDAEATSEAGSGDPASEAVPGAGARAAEAGGAGRRGGGGGGGGAPLRLTARQARRLGRLTRRLALCEHADLPARPQALRKTPSCSRLPCSGAVAARTRSRYDEVTGAFPNRPPPC
jgi:hypothetical protein